MCPGDCLAKCGARGKIAPIAKSIGILLIAAISLLHAKEQAMGLRQTQGKSAFNIECVVVVILLAPSSAKGRSPAARTSPNIIAIGVI